MRGLRLVLPAVLGAALLPGPGRAAPAGPPAPPPGFQTCGGCHGRSGAPPVLSGRGAGEIEAAMGAFRDGSRPATVMDRIAKGFTAEETHALAEWLAAGGGAR